jgi:4a-hydroxytetrahydrobiopterin dehydratase
VAEVLSAEAVAEGIAGLDGWSGDPTGIRRTAKLPSFMAAVRVVGEVARVAEEADHHPDIDIRWRTLTFSCVTHSAGGVTGRDLALAARIDEILRGARDLP